MCPRGVMAPAMLAVVAHLVAATTALQPAMRPVRVAARAPTPLASLSDASDVPAVKSSSRYALAGLASLGALETGAIAVERLTGAGGLGALCTAAGGGCSDVLNGPWATVLGVPLSLIGAICYTAIALLSAAPLVDSEYEAQTAGPVMAGSAAMAAFSGCLMLLLAFVIQQPCALCIGSAAISASLLAVAWSAPLVPDRSTAAVLTGGGGLVSIAAAAFLFFTIGGASSSAPALATDGSPGRPPKIMSHSSTRAMEVAKALRAKGAKFYGAYWCSHCADQKETMGAEAMALLPYLECDANGESSRRDECRAAGVKGYPTWQVDGKLFPGDRDLSTLEAILRGEVEPQGADED